MAVTLTAAAAERVRGYLQETPGAIGLHFGVKKSGCSGWAYVVDLTSAVQSDEHVFESHGVAVRVDDASLSQVDGTEIDWVSQGLNQQFVFRNPQVAGECGCGESFTTDASIA